MAIIIKKGPAGKLSGKVGNAVVTTWRGKDILKDAPGTRTKNKKKAQSEQSLKLGLVTHFLSHFREYVKIGFEKKKGKNPGFQVAVAHNLKYAVTGSYPDFKIDYKKVSLSEGELDMAWGTTLTLTGKNEVHVTWEVPDTSKIKLTGQDRACLILYSEKLNRVSQVVKKTYTRADFEIKAGFPAIFREGTFHIWIFFIGVDGKSVSNTRYVGAVDLPEKPAVIKTDQQVLTP
jgi:hypothetical protein